jgi:predicted transcriptional regulator
VARQFIRVYHDQVDDGFFQGWSKAELLVWLSLSRHNNRKTGDCFPGYRKIAQEMGISISRVHEGIAKLLARDVIEVKPAVRSRGGLQYTYILKDTNSEKKVQPVETPFQKSRKAKNAVLENGTPRVPESGTPTVTETGTPRVLETGTEREKGRKRVPLKESNLKEPPTKKERGNSTQYVPPSRFAVGN